MKSTDWVNVKDRLPEDEERVLVCCKDDGELFPMFAERLNNIWYDDMGLDFENFSPWNVTHWMYIELPKE